MRRTTILPLLATMALLLLVAGMLFSPLLVRLLERASWPRGTRRSSSRRRVVSPPLSNLLPLRRRESGKSSGLATVWWTGRDLSLEVHMKEKKCREPDRHTHRNSAVRPSGWYAPQRRSTPSPR